MRWGVGAAIVVGTASYAYAAFVDVTPDTLVVGNSGAAIGIYDGDQNLDLRLVAGPVATVHAAEPGGDSLTIVPTGPTDGVRVFFATDRGPTGRGDPERWFGNQWGVLSFGVCDVRVPPRTQRRGAEKTIRPFRTPGRPSKKVRLLAVTPIARDSFFAALDREATRGDSSGTLVFVHGYNVRFETAARFAAQLAHDLGFPGRVVLYGWPASRSYLADEEAVEWARPHLQDVLTELARGSGGPVNVLGYSMGASVLARALATMAATSADRGLPPFGEVVFVAPDMESRLFARDVTQALSTARRWTLYGSGRDRAVRVSRRLHGHSRAGEAGRRLLILPGLETIDVSRVNADILGHGYLEEIVGDLHAVFVEHAPPESRRSMTRALRGEAAYWKLGRAR